MKMLKGLEIMGVKQISNKGSAKNEGRISFFGNLLSGFINAKNRPFQKSGIKISGAYFSVTNKAPLKSKSAQLKEAPVFIRPEAEQAPALNSLNGLISKKSSKPSVNELDAKSEALILRVLSAAFVNPGEKALHSLSSKPGATEIVSAELKQTGGRPVLLLTLKDPAKRKALQTFISQIKSSAIKNSIKLPEIQLKTVSGNPKISSEVKTPSMVNGKNTPAAERNGKQILTHKTEKENGQSVASSTKKGKDAGIKENAPTIQEKSTPTKFMQKKHSSAGIQSNEQSHKHSSVSSVIQEKSTPTKFMQKKHSSDGIQPNEQSHKHSSVSSVQPGKSSPVKTDISKGKAQAKQTPAVSKSAVNPAPAAKAELTDRQKTESILSQNKTKRIRPAEMNEAVLKTPKATISARKAMGPSASVPVQGRHKKSEINTGADAKNVEKVSAVKMKPSAKGAAQSLKTASKATGRETSSGIKSHIPFATKETKGKAHPRDHEPVLRRMSRDGSVEVGLEKGKGNKIAQAKTSAPNMDKTGAKSNGNIETNTENHFLKRSMEGKKAEALGKTDVAASAGGKNAFPSIIGNPMGQKAKTAPAFAKNSNRKNGNPQKESAGNLKGKPFNETPWNRKLHDFSGKSGGDSISANGAKTENETILKFGKPGAESKEQKAVNEAAIHAHSVHPKEIQLPEKVLPLVSRITELIQKFKASSKQTSVKTSFKISAGSAGEVEIQLNEKTKEKTIKIMVESDKVRNELQKTLPQIRQNLLLKGIEFNSIAIDTATLGSKMNQTQDQQRGTHKPKTKQTREVENEQEQPAVTQKNYGYNTIEVIA